MTIVHPMTIVHHREGAEPMTPDHRVKINEVFDGEPNAALILAEAHRAAQAATTPQELDQVVKATETAVDALGKAPAPAVPDELSERASYAASAWSEYGRTRRSPFWR